MIPTAVLVIQTFWNVDRFYCYVHLVYPGFSEGYILELLDPEREGITLFLTWVTVCLSLRSLETFIRVTSIPSILRHWVLPKYQ